MLGILLDYQYVFPILLSISTVVLSIRWQLFVLNWLRTVTALIISFLLDIIQSTSFLVYLLVFARPSPKLPLRGTELVGAYTWIIVSFKFKYNINYSEIASILVTRCLSFCGLRLLLVQVRCYFLSYFGTASDLFLRQCIFYVLICFGIDLRHPILYASILLRIPLVFWQTSSY